MSTPVKLLAFALGLAVVFAAALGIGTAVGPIGPAGGATSHPSHEMPADGGTR